MITQDKMLPIRRIGEATRWADVVVHAQTAYWVEIAEDRLQDSAGQVAQILSQIDQTLASLDADRTRLLQVLIYLADLNDLELLNRLWDAWVPAGHAPVRACVQAAMAGDVRVEMVITAAV